MSHQTPDPKHLTLKERGVKSEKICEALIAIQAAAKINPGSQDPSNLFQNYRKIIELLKQSNVNPDFIPSLGGLSQVLELGYYLATGQCPSTFKTEFPWYAKNQVLKNQTPFERTTFMMANCVENTSTGDKYLAIGNTLFAEVTTAGACATSEIARFITTLTTNNLLVGGVAVGASIESRIQEVCLTIDESLCPKTQTRTPVQSLPNSITIPPYPTQPQGIPATMTIHDEPQTPQTIDAETKMLQNALATLTKVPALTQQIEKLTKERDHVVDHAAKLNADIRSLVEKTGEDAKTIQKLKDKAEELESRASMQVTQACAVTLPGGKRNDLDKIAKALRIQRQTLDDELQSFAESCATPLANPVRWAAWCNPNNLDSPLPFHYRHNEPVFLAGESGTGKTFLAEALCQHVAGRRCCITFHEKLSYAKLFIRETVDAGQVRGVLGPVLMAMLTATPLITDEIDHGDVFIQSLLHEVLDKKRVFIPELAMTVYAEDGFRVIATGNSLCDDSGQYHGEVGTALKTRFAGIHVKYPDEKTEASTIKTATNCTQDQADLIARVFTSLRQAVNEQKLAGPISVRESCAVGRRVVMALSDGLTDQQAYRLAFSGACVEKRPVNEQQVAAEIIANLTGIAVTDFLAGIK